MEKNMSDDRQILENQFSFDRNRQAVIARDKYHYIVELRENDSTTRTVLFSTEEHAKAKDLANEFVQNKPLLKG
jgi:hypothetical protein